MTAAARAAFFWKGGLYWLRDFGSPVGGMGMGLSLGCPQPQRPSICPPYAAKPTASTSASSVATSSMTGSLRTASCCSRGQTQVGSHAGFSSGV